MKAYDILKQVLATLESRGKENGYDQKEERSADSIAEIFKVISDKDFTAADVWKHMVALKLARLKSQIMNGSDVTDSIVDLIGYTALLGEELTKVADVADGNDGWLTWLGGDIPEAPRTKVEVKYRDGDAEISEAGNFRWSHFNSSGDIVKYRVL